MDKNTALAFLKWKIPEFSYICFDHRKHDENHTRVSIYVYSTNTSDGQNKEIVKIDRWVSTFLDLDYDHNNQEIILHGKLTENDEDICAKLGKAIGTVLYPKHLNQYTILLDYA